MGPRMSAAGSGPQLGFIQRKTALSKHVPARFSDGPSDGLTPRGPGRYLAAQMERLNAFILTFPSFLSILFNVCSGHVVVMVTGAERISRRPLQRKRKVLRLRCRCCRCPLSRM